MWRGKRRWVWAGAVAATMGFGALEATAAQLNRELSRLILDHPRIQSALKNLEGSRSGVGEAQANYYPTISATAETGHEIVDSPAERNATDGQAGKHSSRSPQSANITVTHNLFNGFLTNSQVRTARLNKELSSINLETARQGVLFDGVFAYIDVLRQKRLVELSDEDEATIQRQLNLEDERVQRGSGVALDVLDAKRRLQLAKERRVSFEGAREDAVSRYIQVFGHAPNLDAMVDPVPPVEMIPSTVERAIEIAITENPAVTTATTNIEVARQQRQTVLAEFSPSVDVEGQFNFEKHSNTTIGVRRDYSVLLSASWDLFSGFSTRESLAQANFQYRASQDDRDNTARRVIEQTRFAWQALLTARRRIGLLENAVNIASEIFSSRKRLREAGKETVLNVLDSETELFNAQINFTSASYDERLAVYQLLLAMGRLRADYLGFGG